MPRQQETEGRSRKGGPDVIYQLLLGYSTTVTVFLREGFGCEALGLPGVIGFFVLFIFAADTKSMDLWLYLVIWVFALVCQRVSTAKLIRRGHLIHSKYAGYPQLAARLFRQPKENRAKTQEIALVFSLGVLIANTFSLLIGALLVSASVSLLLVRLIDQQANMMNVRRFNDAMIEHQAMQQFWRKERDDF